MRRSRLPYTVQSCSPHALARGSFLNICSELYSNHPLLSREGFPSILRTSDSLVLIQILRSSLTGLNDSGSSGHASEILSFVLMLRITKPPTFPPSISPDNNHNRTGRSEEHTSELQSPYDL